MRKTILLFLAFLFSLGVMTMQAENESGSIGFEETVECVKAKKFVIRAKTLYSQDENRYFTVNSQCNFLVVNGDKAKVQVTNDEHIKFYEEHGMSDVDMKFSKKGDLLLTALLKDERKAIRLKVKLYKDTNKCEAIFSSAKRSGNYTLVGEMVPGDVSNVVKLF